MSKPSSSITTWLVTGSSRGIGLEIVRQLLTSTDNLVVAACRAPEKAAALSGLKAGAKGTLYIVQLDVSDFDSVRASAKDLDAILGNTGLDVLINNAAIPSWDVPFSVDPEELLQVVRTNAVGPALLSSVALPFLEKGRRKTILHISSTTGSMSSVDTVGVRHVSYAMSKAALNMLTVKQKLERPDLMIITLCPGWVKTDMGGQNGLLEPKESVANILKVINSVTPADSGKFLRHNGEEIPW
ncbi:NAD-P-binding protein [Trametes meyenii]|nr:NAD-P-binding protein [Trametes meyenii]